MERVVVVVMLLLVKVKVLLVLNSAIESIMESVIVDIV